MPDPLALGFLLQVASGVAILTLGLGLVAVRPRRRHTVSFGLFLALWAGTIIAGNMSAIALGEAQPLDARQWILLQVALLSVAYLPLAYFAKSFPPGSGSEPGWLFAGLIALPAVGGAVAMLVDPTLLHQGFESGGSLSLSNWGPLYPLYPLLIWAAVYAVVARLYVVSTRSDTWIDRRAATYVVGALLIAWLFDSAKTLVLFGGPMATGEAAVLSQDLVYVGAAAIGLGLFSWIGFQLARGDQRSGVGTRHLWSIALPATVGFGAVSGLSRLTDVLPPLMTQGLWRLAAAALIVHGIVRFELFGVSSRWGDRLAAGGLVALSVAGGIGVYQLLAGLTGSSIAALIATQILIAGVLLAVLELRPELLDRLTLFWNRLRSNPDRAARALEVYEAQLSSGQDPPVGLDELREALEIGESEHQALARLVEGVRPAVTLAQLGSGVRLDGRYELEEPIGEGARSIVYRAVDRREQRPVAVKLFDGDRGDPTQGLRRFLWEARVGREIDHPNVVETLAAGVHEGCPYLVLELLEGGSLRDHLDEEGPLEPREAVRLLDGVLAALAHLHGQGLVHGDLKPTNVLLTSEGDPRVADLGAARRVQPDETRSIDEQPAGFGTPLYMSPEVARGLPPTPRSDIYGAGALLYEALTGEHYLGLEDAGYEEVRRAIEVAEIRPARTGLGDLELVWRRALSKEPAGRFGSAGAMREALLDAVESKRAAAAEMEG